MIRWQPTMLAVAMLVVAGVAVVTRRRCVARSPGRPEQRSLRWACTFTGARDERPARTSLRECVPVRTRSTPTERAARCRQPAVGRVDHRSVPEIALVPRLEHSGMSPFGGARAPRSVDRILAWYERSPTRWWWPRCRRSETRSRSLPGRTSRRARVRCARVHGPRRRYRQRLTARTPLTRHELGSLARGSSELAGATRAKHGRPRPRAPSGPASSMASRGSSQTVAGCRELRTSAAPPLRDLAGASLDGRRAPDRLRSARLGPPPLLRRRRDRSVRSTDGRTSGATRPCRRPHRGPSSFAASTSATASSRPSPAST